MADDKPKQISVVFYRTATRTEVVREWLLGSMRRTGKRWVST
jgi:hypothetical protein